MLNFLRRARAKAPSLTAHVDYSGVFPGNELLVAGWVHDVDAPIEPVEILAGETPLAIEDVRVVRGSRPDVAARHGEFPSDRWGFVVFVRLPSAGSDGPIALRLRSGAHTTLLPLRRQSPGGERFTGAIKGFSHEDRKAATNLAVEVLGASAIHLGSTPFAEYRGSVRMHIELAAAIGTSGMFFKGWLFDPDEVITEFRVRAGANVSADLLATMRRMPRPDVERAFELEPSVACDAGFACFAPLAVSSSTDEFEFLLTTRQSEVLSSSAAATPLARDPTRLSEALLSAFQPMRPGDLELLERHIGPALEATWTPRGVHESEIRVWDAGKLPENPTHSVLIPLYGRADFMLYQLTEFVRDPDFSKVEIIYVVDDPRLTTEAVSLARSLHELWGVNLRVVHLGPNRGFAGANNVGAEQASGRYLVLLNSDVVPVRRGWISRLTEALEALPDVGPIAPRLLFHDETIQHDGIAFRRDPAWPTLWLNDHPGKGLPAYLVEGPRLERVAAVSAACMLVERALYRELGGLDERYIVGDFEDSDFCLRARRLGRKSYILRDETLYHLERQSQSMARSDDFRLALTLYNAWRHTERWGAEIEASLRSST